MGHVFNWVNSRYFEFFYSLLKIKNNIMGAIIICLVIIVMGVGLYIFDHTKAGKKFFAE